MTLSTQWISATTALAAHSRIWDTLVAEDPGTLEGLDATSSPCWHEALMQSREEAKSSQVFVVSEDGVPTALLPVVLKHDGRFAQRLAAVTDLYGGRNGIATLAPPERSYSLLLTGLGEMFPRWGKFEITLPEGGKHARALAAACKAMGFARIETINEASPFVHLLESADEFNRGVSKKLLRNLRSSRGKAERSSALTFREYTQPADALPLLADVKFIESHSWKEQAGTSITTNPEQEKFFEAVVPISMQAGMMYGLVLFLGEEPISYQLGLKRGHVYICLKNSMTAAHKELRPSYLLKAELFDRLRNLGVRTVDFMGVAEPHKLVWSDRTGFYRRVTNTVYRNNWRGHSLALRQKLGAMLRTKSSLARDPLPQAHND